MKTTNTANLEVPRHDYTATRNDISRGIAEYAKAGFSVVTPDQFKDYTSETQHRLALQMGQLVAGVYGRDALGNYRYPLNVYATDAIVAAVNQGTTLPYALVKDDDLYGVAMTVDQSKAGSCLRIGELGRAATRDNSVSLRALLKLRITDAVDTNQWDILVSNIRTAGSSYVAPDGTIVPSGEGVHGIYFGGRRFGEKIPVMASSFGWRYAFAGDIEPFTNLTLPVNPATWADAFSGAPRLHLPAHMHQLFQASTQPVFGVSSPIIDNVDRIANQPSAQIDPGWVCVEQPTELSYGKYKPAQDAKAADTFSLREIVAQLEEINAPSAEIAIPHDMWNVAGDGAALASYLHENGWVASGWQINTVAYGKVDMMFAKLRASVQEERLVRPGLPERYFCGDLEKIGRLGSMVLMSTADNLSVEMV